VLERLARAQLEADPKLRAEFEQKVAGDASFAASPCERLNWFLQRSPWWDERIGLYPVGKIDSMRGLPLPKAPARKEAYQDPDYEPDIPDRASVLPGTDSEIPLTFFMGSIYPVPQRLPENLWGISAWHFPS